MDKRTGWHAHLTMGMLVCLGIGLAYFPMTWAYWWVTDLVGWQWNEYAYPIIWALVPGPILGLVMWARERRSGE